MIQKRSKYENKGKVPTETELVLEQTQQGTSYEVLVDPHGFKGYSNQTRANDKAIFVACFIDADNRPLMLENDMYYSWKSRMELYMMNIQHGRMIFESVEHGPLIWPTIEENGMIRPRKYSELTHAEAIQADCDVKATNIILQGLPPE
nr:hypothetical protein [Tanacetum cinerariifolium]